MIGSVCGRANCSEWRFTQFATAKIGAILVNINPAYRTHELEYALNQSGARFLVSADSFKNSNYRDMLYELAPELKTSTEGALKSLKLPQLECVIKVKRRQASRHVALVRFDAGVGQG